MNDPAGPPTALSRRRFLTSAATVTGAAVVGGVVGYGLASGPLAQPSAPGGVPPSPAPSPTTAPSGGSAQRVPFHGTLQAGIVTPAQDRLAFAAFDVQAPDRGGLIALLRLWTDAAVRMTAGEVVGDPDRPPLAPPDDTGEAMGSSPAFLTLTIGFGPSLFDERFGLADARPVALAELPAFPGDALEPARSDGDLCVQACADDPQVAFHAVRNLARLARGSAALRWFQLGFGRTSSTTTAQATPRNLMGFLDGTNNVHGDDATDTDGFVWVGDETDQPWLRGGSYLVARRIRMHIENWDRAALGEQEAIVGRFKRSGAPLTGQSEHDTVDLTASDASGEVVIADDAHIRLAAPGTNAGQKILRRGYSFTDGVDVRTGQLDAGLFFICFQKDPRDQFVAIQRRLGGLDSLNEYIVHTGSGVFACPPGVAEGGFWGDSLLP